MIVEKKEQECGIRDPLVQTLYPVKTRMGY